MSMNIWISDSVDFLISIARFLTTTPIFYIVCCLLLLPVVKLVKGLVN